MGLPPVGVAILGNSDSCGNRYGGAGNAADALFMRLADRMIKLEYFAVVLEQLSHLNWAQFDSAATAMDFVLRPLSQKSLTDLPESMAR